jgi:PIN domain nuclease of toxin-antitoxin system
MKTQIVLDTSAILALLAMEEGHEVVAENLENTVVSSVTLSEVITVLVRRGLKHEDVTQSLKDTFPQIEEFNAAQAIIAASFVEPELSFADRACLSLAKSKNLPVLTNNKVLVEIEDEISVKLIR